jgi:hypothetical protein
MSKATAVEDNFIVDSLDDALEDLVNHPNHYNQRE